MYSRYFTNYLPLERGCALHLKKFKSPLPKVWLKLAQWFWRRRKCEQFTMPTKPPTTMTTGNGQIVIRKAHLSLWLRRAYKKVDFFQFCSIFYSCKSCLLFNSFIIWRFTNLKKNCLYETHRFQTILFLHILNFKTFRPLEAF